MAKPSRPKLTHAQVRALENLADGHPSSLGLRGQSEYGGHHQTMQSLRRKLFVNSKDEITEEGRQALEALK